MFSIYLVICLVMVTATSGALAVALADRRQQTATRTAAQLWRDIQLRNGITEPIPWHSPDSPINRPGMVQVHPPIHPWETRPVPGDRPPSPSDLAINPPMKQGSSDSATLNETRETVPELPMEPLELTDPPAAGEQARVLRLHGQGLTQNTIIKHVWGASPGGSKKYTEARRRYLDYINTIPSEVATHA